MANWMGAVKEAMTWPESIYEVLGVEVAASVETCEAAFDAAIKLCHPDVCDDDDAGERTHRLLTAKAIYSNAKARAVYDESLVFRRPGSSGAADPGPREEPAPDLGDVLGGFEERETYRPPSAGDVAAARRVARGAVAERIRRAWAASVPEPVPGLWRRAGWVLFAVAVAFAAVAGLVEVPGSGGSGTWDPSVEGRP